MYLSLLAHAATLNNLCIKYLAISQRPLSEYFIHLMKMNKNIFQIII